MSRRGSKRLAEPGGICVSARVQEDAAGRLDLTFEDMGEQRSRTSPGRCGCIAFVPAGTTPVGIAPAAQSAETALALPDKPSIAVLPFRT